MKEFHFNSGGLHANILKEGDYKSYSLLFLIQILFTVAVTANFLIFTLLRIYKNSRSLIIKYVFGGSKSEILINSFVEVSFILLLAVILAYLIFYLMGDSLFRQINLDIHFSYILSFNYVIELLMIILALTIIIMIFLFLFFRNKTIIRLFEINSTGKKIFSFRNVSLLLESIVFIIVISSFYTIYRQVSFLENKSPGYDYKNIIIVSFNGADQVKGYNYIKNYLSGLSSVVKVSGATYIPPNNSSMTFPVSVSGSNKKQIRVEAVFVDYSFLEILDVKLLYGRYVSPNRISDKGSIIINKSCMEDLNINNPIGKEISGMKIVGVVDNFYFHSLYKKLNPMIFEIDESMLGEMVIKSKNPSMTLKSIKHFENKYAGKFKGLLNYRFLEDDLEKLYYKERIILKFITIISLFVTLLLIYGYFAFSVYDARFKLKSLTIRKIYGASVQNLYKEGLNNYFFIYLVSLIFSFPLVEYLSGIWLNNFAYKINLSVVDYFILTAAGAFIIFISIGGNIKNAVKMNPSEVLRQYDRY